MMTAPKLANGYKQQVIRANETPDRLRERLQEALADNDRLREQIRRLQQVVEQYQCESESSDAQRVLQVGGRGIGNQSALARALHVGPDRVSKWHKERRLKFFTDADGIDWFDLTQGRPARKKRSKV